MVKSDKHNSVQKITLRKAREILGDESRSLTDEELLDMLRKMTELARTYIKSVPKF